MRRRGSHIWVLVASVKKIKTIIKTFNMGQSILVFVSHSSEDKEDFIEPIVDDLEKCYINVWLDKKNRNTA